MRSTRRMKSNVTEARNVSLREMNRPMFERILNFSVILKVMVVIMSLNSVRYESVVQAILLYLR